MTHSPYKHSSHKMKNRETRVWNEGYNAALDKVLDYFELDKTIRTAIKALRKEVLP